MYSYYSLVALDIANDRIRDAALARRAQSGYWDLPARPGLARRSLASAFALVSRGSASIARRLDVHTADDLGRTLAAAK